MWFWIIVAVFIFLIGIRIVRPVEKGVIERLGKFRKVADQGFHWIIPIIDRMIKVNTTEQMVDAMPQEVITMDNLNAMVDAQVYFKVKRDDESVKSSQYNVNNYKIQIVALARTTLRNVIGNLSLKDANSKRGELNGQLQGTMQHETRNWGIEIVRTELKEIMPPQDVQETMNKVVKAQNEKIAAVDFATATETQADGARRAKVKEAEGYAQGVVLKANAEAEAKIAIARAEAEAIKLVSESADKHFVGNAQVWKKLLVTETTLKDNVKYYIPQGTSLVQVVSETAEVAHIPVPMPQAVAPGKKQ
jgi:regulator of protease activity HflC (stomatin/prohibitin superfamily)